MKRRCVCWHSVHGVGTQASPGLPQEVSNPLCNSSLSYHQLFPDPILCFYFAQFQSSFSACLSVCPAVWDASREPNALGGLPWAMSRTLPEGASARPQVLTGGLEVILPTSSPQIGLALSRSEVLKSWQVQTHRRETLCLSLWGSCRQRRQAPYIAFCRRGKTSKTCRGGQGGRKREEEAYEGWKERERSQRKA